MHEDRNHLLNEFERMRSEIDRFFEAFSSPSRLLKMRPHVWCPPTDVYETEEYAIVKLEIGGMNQDDFNITLADGMLTVSGARAEGSNVLAYQRMEIEYGEFVSQVHIPWQIVEDRIEARYQQGFLYVQLPKQQVSKTRIQVVSLDPAPDEKDAP